MLSSMVIYCSFLSAVISRLHLKKMVSAAVNSVLHSKYVDSPKSFSSSFRGGNQTRNILLGIDVRATPQRDKIYVKSTSSLIKTWTCF